MSKEKSEEEYICLINEKNQYSIWLGCKKIPHGWKEIGLKGSKEEAMRYIDEAWKDMKIIS